MTRRYYVVECVLDGRSRFLLWYSNERDGVELDKGGAVLSASSCSEIRRRAGRAGMVVEDEAPARFDMDELSDWVAEPHPPPPVTLIGACWGLFADIAASIGRKFDEDRDATEDIYDKVFWAQNLPSVTPPNQRHTPVWSSSELSVLSDLMARGIQLVRRSLENDVDGAKD